MATSDLVLDVGDTLVTLLRAGIGNLVESANIKVVTSDVFEEALGSNKPQITVFLYRVSVNAEMRNAPPRQLPDGRITRPLLPLELRYLITPWAQDPRIEYQVIGRIMQILYDHAELGVADLQGASWEAEDSVQLVFESLPVDEHYRIWDTTALPYRLSLTYLARVVGLEPGEAREVPPVTRAIFGRAAS